MSRAFHFMLHACLLAFLVSHAPDADAREMNDTEKRLFKDLKAVPAFRQMVPAASRLTRLEFAGSVVPGDLVIGADPQEIAIVPKAIARSLAVNCSSTQTAVRGGSVAGTFSNSASFTTTRGWEVGTSFSFTADWPVAESTWSFSASYNGSVAEMSGEEESWTITETWSVPLLPRTESDILMQVTQQEIDDQPFHFDLELLGRALVYYKPEPTWVASSGSVPANAIIGGEESSPDRKLPICRAWYAGARHPGKVVGSKCNISWGGKEYPRGSFEVLTGDKDRFDWKEHGNGSTDKETGVVAGKESRDDQHDGQLYVCRAKHRGGIHPGKLVINHCMFGYGGKEIEKSRYEILTFEEGGERRFPVEIQSLLPLDKRTFRVNGKFDGTLSLSTYSYVSDPRPVTEFRCPSVPEASLARKPEVEEAPGPRALTLASAETGGRAARALADGSADGPAPSLDETEILYDTPLEADALGTAEPRSYLNSRVLRLESPHLFGPDVLALQHALNAAGWRIRADGFYGPGTDEALRHFQRAHGLGEDGLFGPRTQAMLGL